MQELDLLHCRRKTGGIVRYHFTVYVRCCEYVQPLIISVLRDEKDVYVGIETVNGENMMEWNELYPQAHLNLDEQTELRTYQRDIYGSTLIVTNSRNNVAV